VQLVYIWGETLGTLAQYNDQYYGTKAAYTFLTETLCREYGCFLLTETSSQFGGRNHYLELTNFPYEHYRHGRQKEALTE
jgi:hypothetical protein